jgi:hypothetical protein
MELRDAALTNALHEFVRLRQIAGQRYGEAPELREKADQIASDVDGCYRRRHCLSRETLGVVELQASSGKRWLFFRKKLTEPKDCSVLV